jgi:hypothetical protein
MRPTPTVCLAAVMAALLIASVPGAARVKVRAQFDEKFDFSQVRTWAWNDKGPGEVKMARTADDDPEAVRKNAEPVIRESVLAETAKRGLKAADGGPPDIEITYYLLITVGTQSQYMGQFLPTTGEWGIPPIVGATQSYSVVDQGSLVLDLSAKDEVVWRGIAQAQIKPGTTLQKRQTLIREAVRDILKQYPPKSKKK